MALGAMQQHRLPMKLAPAPQRLHTGTPACRAIRLHCRVVAAAASADAAPPASRRQALAMQAAAAVVLVSSSSSALRPRPARAASAFSASAAEPPAAAPPTPGSSAPYVPFFDNDYELQVPGDYTYFETVVPYVERGPQPERSPVRARWESPDRRATLSIIMRNAQTIKPTLLQVSDITQYGSELEAAKLLLPRGAKLLAASRQVTELPPKETPLGTVDIPPRTYYRYEFTTGNGLHVAMAAAAQRGKVYVCGGSTSLDGWPLSQQQLLATTASFRIKDPASAL